MSDNTSIVYVVDDDESVRKSLSRLLTTSGFDAIAYPTANEFLANASKTVIGCLILDVRLPGITGLELQNLMKQNGFSLPIIFITGHGDIPMSVRAMKKGAIEFLTKPFDHAELISSVKGAIEIHRNIRKDEEELAQLEACYNLLTQREKEVFSLVITGKLNKQIAFDLGVGEKTIKVHRSRVVQKMQCKNFADLVRMGEKLNLSFENE